jgi:hypothetical protein
MAIGRRMEAALLISSLFPWYPSREPRVFTSHRLLASGSFSRCFSSSIERCYSSCRWPSCSWSCRSKPVSRPRAGAIHRIGLTRPPRPPAPNLAGSSNWASSSGGRGSGGTTEGMSSYVGLHILNGRIRIGQKSTC